MFTLDNPDTAARFGIFKVNPTIAALRVYFEPNAVNLSEKVLT
ncbi:hypothetical protein SAMN05421748_11878 [Paractinoplanes atraurantiacus]|uniref:Uncharacterized protein n=1 Tax=Paractinoplanes atraurantiacus TaxID=1036182 RepID=A0A285JAC8_9ACTN|nr:hypothetical protein SAMN05421748_11878 [Actinoplanes atraurantiacus]